MSSREWRETKRLLTHVKIGDLKADPAYIAKEHPFLALVDGGGAGRCSSCQC